MLEKQIDEIRQRLLARPITSPAPKGAIQVGRTCPPNRWLPAVKLDGAPEPRPPWQALLFPLLRLTIVSLNRLISIC